jgi:K+-sensing histidine kinase KdpD
LQDKVGETEKLCLKEIEHNVRRLITEVESLLELSRIENDSLTITSEYMNVKEQLYLVVKNMRPIFKQMKVNLLSK